MDKNITVENVRENTFIFIFLDKHVKRKIMLDGLLDFNNFLIVLDELTKAADLYENCLSRVLGTGV